MTTTAKTVDELAAHAKLGRSTIYDMLKDPATAHWVVAHSTHLVETHLGAVHAKLLDHILNSREDISVRAIKIFLDRFDPKYNKPVVAGKLDPRAGDDEMLDTMTEVELISYVEQLARRLGLELSRVAPLAPIRTVPTGGS